MPKRIRLRTLTTEEEIEIRRLSTSRKEPMRLVQRARVLAAMLDDPGLAASRAGEKAGFKGAPMGIQWIKRFNEKGLSGLMDAERTGRPATHSQKIRSNLLDLAFQKKPRSLGYPFELWTLERLQRAFTERHGVHLSDSTIWTWVEAEGFRWRKQESWFHEPEKHDPEFAQKRGSS